MSNYELVVKADMGGGEFEFFSEKDELTREELLALAEEFVERDTLSQYYVTEWGTDGDVIPLLECSLSDWLDQEIRGY